MECHLARPLLQSQEKQEEDDGCRGDEGHYVLKCYLLYFREELFKGKNITALFKPVESTLFVVIRPFIIRHET